MNWLLARLHEPSTWRGIILLLTVCGWKLEPDQAEAIIAGGLAIVGLIGVFTKDEPKTVKIELPGIELQSKSLHESFKDKGYEPHGQPSLNSGAVFDESQFDERGFNKQSRHDRDDGYVGIDAFKAGLGYSDEEETTRNPADLDIDRRLRVPADHRTRPDLDDRAGFNNQ